jgi:hypothetical protein
MKHVLYLLLLFSVTLFMSCGSSQNITSFWVNPENSPDKRYTGVFIMAIAADKGAQTVVETDLAEMVKAKGLKAVRSVDVFISSFTKENKPTKEQVMAKVTESGCDAVFTAALVDVKSEQRYVPGTTTYGYAPYPAYGYYGSYYSYYDYSYAAASTPGYYTTDKTYFIEANFYDGASGQIRWSMQSTAYNPSSLDSFSKGYCRLLGDELEKQNAKRTGTK